MTAELPVESPFEFDSSARRRLTHQLFRFPAKFHPPVVRTLIERYSKRGDRILDPFCGSGTLLVEAATAGRAATGLDVDPLAVFVSNAKVHPIDPDALRRTAAGLLELLRPTERSVDQLASLMSEDMSETAFEEARKHLEVAPIPLLAHWFRRYVAIDLAQIRQAIEGLDGPAAHRRFYLLCFAAIIRSTSNADPVPVSGLEVTAHMKRIDAAGRVIDVHGLFKRKLQRAIKDMEEYWAIVPRDVQAAAYVGNATKLGRHGRSSVAAVITSPPYHGAVDYYRRHQLEMFWLRLTNSQEDRLEVMRRYVGRPMVAAGDPLLQRPSALPPGASLLEGKIKAVSQDRGRAFRHYCLSMQRVFSELSTVLEPRAPAVFVVGNGRWSKQVVDTTQLIVELAGRSFTLAERFAYPVRNRYMSYSRRNDASIDREHVLVFRRTRD